MRILTDPDALEEFDTDEAGSFHAAGLEAVYLPSSATEVAQILRDANTRNLPVTVSGGGTGITGGRVATSGGWVLSTRELRSPGHCDFERIEQEQFGELFTICLDRSNLLARAPSGITLEHLNRTLPGDLCYPPDPTEATATLGGTIATNASGAGTFHYGPTRDWVLGLEVILPTGDHLNIRRGEVIESGGTLAFTSTEGTHYTVPVPGYRMPGCKNAAGLYACSGMDLVDLFIGAEGILGIVTSALLKLHTRPADVASEIAFFSTEEDALAFLTDLRAAAADGLQVLSLEYFDANSLRFMQHPQVRGEYAAAVYTEIVGTLDDIDPLLEALEAHNVAQDWFAETEADRKEQREFRHSLPEGVNTYVRRRGSHKVGTDLVVPAEHFPAMLALYHEVGEEFKRRCPREGEHYLMFGHIGNYHLHFNFLAHDQQELEVAGDLYARLARQAIAFGGTISGEHGVGKKTIIVDNQPLPYLQLMYGEEGLKQIAATKRALDPKWLLNPGNVIPSPQT
ncbi:MAG: FAD-binding oxidoreductase [Armatimonadia bacterium]